MLATIAPYSQYFDTDGSPLDDGSVYFGTANTNPETNPITVYWDLAGTQPAAQPVRTLNGFTVRNGTPATVYANGDYSLTVRNRNGTILNYIEAASSISNDITVVDLFTELADETDPTHGAGMVGYGYSASHPANTVGEALSNSVVSVKDYPFNATGDGVTDDWQAIRDALDSGAHRIYFPPGTYYSTKCFNLWETYHLFGAGGFQSGFSPSIIKFADTTCGFVVHRADTTCDDYGYNQTTQASLPTAGDGTVIEGLTIQRGNGSDTTVDGVTHGVRMRARAYVDRCYISGFAGDGVHIEATSGGAASVQGNANNWGISNSRILNNRDGVFVDGADVNQGLGLHVDSSSNQRYGIYDSSFLGCTWIGCHCNGNTTLNVLQDSNSSRSTFINQYTEGSGSSTLEVSATAVGGIWAGGSGVSGGNRFVEGQLVCGDIDAESLDLSSSATGALRNSMTWNTGSINNARKSTHAFQAGVSTNYLPIGSVYGRGGASNTVTAGAVGLEVYDPLATSTASITAITQANPGVITTSAPHGLTVGDRVAVLSVGGMTQLNNISFLVGTTPLTTTLTLTDLAGTAIDTTAYTAYTAGGTIGLANGYGTVLEARGSTKDLVPGVDNTWDFGDASFRWKEIFAGNGTINTSDGREKEQERALSVAELAVSSSLKGLIKAFKWTSAVELKGDGARWHFGVIAQDVKEAFEAQGLDGFDYGVLCYDEWDAEFDDDGNEVSPAGNRYGVRYNELLAFIIAGI